MIAARVTASSLPDDMPSTRPVDGSMATTAAYGVW